MRVWMACGRDVRMKPDWDTRRACDRCIARAMLPCGNATCHPMRDRSSVAEQAPFKRLAVGSNPTGPTLPPHDHPAPDPPSQSLFTIPNRLSAFRLAPGISLNDITLGGKTWRRCGSRGLPACQGPSNSGCATSNLGSSHANVPHAAGDRNAGASCNTRSGNARHMCGGRCAIYATRRRAASLISVSNRALARSTLAIQAVCAADARAATIISAWGSGSMAKTSSI